MSASRVLGLMMVSALLAVGCSSPKKIDVGGACILNSDCNGSLVCTMGKCHDACRASADCPAGQSCITTSDQSTVCQGPTPCVYNSDCLSPLACGADQRCRNECQKDADCTPGQTCTTTGTCAEPNQVDPNKNLIGTDSGVSGSGGASGASGAGGGGDAGMPDASGAQPDAPMTPASLVASPQTLALGPVAMGQSSKEGHITISNQGHQSSRGITFQSDNAEFVIQDPASGDCISGETVLSAGATCTVWVTLTPVAAGARTGTFIFQATPGGSGTVSLQGTGSCAADTLPDAQGNCVPVAGAVWVQRGTQQNWRSVASSSDGTLLVAAASGGNIYTSADSGQTWLARDSSRRWVSVASSADGRKLVAASIPTPIGPTVIDSDGYIYTSTDAGANWTQRGTQHAWSAVASSADGARLAALIGMTPGIIEPSGTSLQLSTNFGETWTAQGAFDNVSGGSIASSSDGMKLVAAVSSSIHTSADGGATWTAHGPVQPWTAVASSEDGSRLVAVANGGMGSGGYIYTSVDSGTNWTEGGSWQNWRAVASSSGGQRLVAAADGGYLYTSIDGGVNWAQRGSVRSWQSAASSSDGTKLVAVANSGYVYTSAGPVP